MKKMSPAQERSVRYRVMLIIGVIPTPPAMRTMLSASVPVNVKRPTGPPASI